MPFRHRGLTIGVLFGCVLAVAFAANPATASAADEDRISILPGSSQFNFVAYGDIRFTNPTDTHDTNPEARQALVQRIAELRPAFLLVTGDLVLRGGDANDWRVWESETKPWREAHLPVFPVLGNHEVYGDPQALQYFAHFPELKQRRWYEVHAGNALFFMLDSNADNPGGAQWNWLEGQLPQVPGEVDFLFFVLHHPPYTHSSSSALRGGHSARAPEQELAKMLERLQATTRARMIVISGHVHNYERYEHGNVTYIVSGGGGATPYTVPRSPGDAYREPGPTYHFVRFFIDGRQLRAEMVKLELQAGKPTWRVRDSFQLNAPASAAAAR
jgi:hypothetical protein